MSEKTANIIIWFLWAIFLFVSWGILSFAQGMEGQWWSLIKINPEKYGPWALEISYLKIFIFASVSVVVSYFINSFFWKKKM